MKLTTRLKFLSGIVFIIALCAALFVYLDYSMSRVQSVDAQLQSDTYTVGIDYSGIVEKQYVDEGAYIKSGDPLFEVRSSTLADAIRNNEVAKSSLLYSVSDNGNVLVSAAANGRIQSIAYRQGAFVPANSEIATVNSENGLYISSTYTLSSPDYARINTKSKVAVTLPDNKKIEGTVYDISLETIDKQVVTTVKTRIDQDAINQTSFAVGTPVKSVLYLDTKTWYSRIATTIQSLLQPTSGK
ncbi:HlyD family efflux transporter periplasmic adaptor subunit [Candidatus Saccharibacteria bacterium]|nr:HlyD family efflux transporter periplasmic adaptor subunit [Candidatus Saccharibacteria bacterium]